MIFLTITGNVGQDAQIKEMKEGKKLFFTVASSDNAKTHWVNCFLSFNDGSKAIDLLKKGVRVIIQGYVFQTFYESEGQKIPSLSANVSYYEVVKSN